MSNLSYSYQPNIYEKDIFINQAESLLRPGGLTLTKRLADACAFTQGAKVIDLGCGTAMTVQFLRDQYGMGTAGIDSSAVLLDRGIKLFRDLNLIQAEGEALPVASCTVNGVFAECSLSVMHYSDRILSEIDRILKPGGKLCISDLYIRNPEEAESLRNIPCKGCISGAPTYTELMQKLKFNGFVVLGWEDQSLLLREFTARFIMEHESINAYWQTGSCNKEDEQLLWAAIKKAGLGYFWLIAEKINRKED